jgi:hypothetical protein
MMTTVPESEFVAGATLAYLNESIGNALKQWFRDPIDLVQMYLYNADSHYLFFSLFQALTRHLEVLFLGHRLPRILTSINIVLLAKLDKYKVGVQPRYQQNRTHVATIVTKS